MAVSGFGADVAKALVGDEYGESSPDRATSVGYYDDAVAMTTVELSFDAASHSADAIQRAAYKYCDYFALDFRRDDDRFVCVLHFEEEDAISAITHDFRIEVLDQVLRERIRVETEPVRNLILALAFSETDLVDG